MSFGDYSSSPMTPQTARRPGSWTPPAAPDSPLPRPRYDLADYLGMLRRGWWILIASMLLGLVAAVGVTIVQTKVYEASTAVLVLPTGVEDPDLAGGRSKNTINLDTEAQLVQSSATANLAKELLDSDTPARDLLRDVSVTVPPNTAIMEIRYAAGTPQAARAGSAAFADAYLSNRQNNAKADISGQIEALRTQIAGIEKQLRVVLSREGARAESGGGTSYLDAQQQNLSSQLNALSSRLNELRTTPVSGGRVISEAQRPTEPSHPVLPLNLAAGMMIGLLLGGAAVGAREYLDRRVHHGADVVRRAGVPLLCELTDRLASRSTPTGDAVFGAFTPAGRMFSRLRNEVAACLPAGSVVVVTGACRGPAAPTLAANLAVAFTRAGNSAAVVYADVPGTWEIGAGAPATRLFGVPTTPGLSEVLAGRVPLDDALLAAARYPELRVLPTGSIASSAGLLQSEAARRMLASLKSRVEYVIVHAPSAAESADAQSLAIHADGVLLAVDLRRTTDVEVADAADQLHRVGTPLLGAVVLPPFTAGKPARKKRTRSVAPSGDTPTLVFPRVTDDRDVTDDTGHRDNTDDDEATDHDAESSAASRTSPDLETTQILTPYTDDDDSAMDDRPDRGLEIRTAGSGSTGHRRPNPKPSRTTSDTDATLVITGGPASAVRSGRHPGHKPKGRRR